MRRQEIERQNREYYWNTYSVFERKKKRVAFTMIVFMCVASVGIHSLNLFQWSIETARRQNLENQEVIDHAVSLFRKDIGWSMIGIGVIAALLLTFVAVMYIKKSYGIYQCKKLVLLIPIGICTAGIIGEIVYYVFFREIALDIWLVLRTMLELTAFLPAIFGSRLLLPLELRKPVETILKFIDWISEFTLKKLK